LATVLRVELLRFAADFRLRVDFLVAAMRI
jgi:hypothetical protein